MVQLRNVVLSAALAAASVSVLAGCWVHAGTDPHRGDVHEDHHDEHHDDRHDEHR